jgi:phosphosulfolactate phosphohydrolase-like enzyme
MYPTQEQAFRAFVHVHVYVRHLTRISASEEAGLCIRILDLDLNPRSTRASVYGQCSILRTTNHELGHGLELEFELEAHCAS